MTIPPVVVYTTPTCPWCVRVKEFLAQRGVTFTEKNVAADRTAAMEMVSKTRQMGVPVVAIGDDVVIGFDRARLEALLGRYSRPAFGARVANAATITAKQGGLPLFGAYVGSVAERSIAEQVGLKAGDIITEFNLRPIRNADDLTTAIGAVPIGGTAVVVWTRGAQTMRGEALFANPTTTA